MMRMRGVVGNTTPPGSSVVDAVNELNIQQPLVVRLNGSNVEEGRRVLHDSGIAIETADELGDAAALAVEAAKSGRRRSRSNN